MLLPDDNAFDSQTDHFIGFDRFHLCPEGVMATLLASDSPAADFGPEPWRNPAADWILVFRFEQGRMQGKQVRVLRQAGAWRCESDAPESLLPRSCNHGFTTGNRGNIPSCSGNE